MRSQLRFPVVTFVLVALTCLAVLSRLLAPYIVLPNNQRLVGARPSYLTTALHQHIAWYPLSDRAFQDARRQDRPILLVVGAPWSMTARQMDNQVFGNVTVQKVLAREFVCIRADSVETPDWMSAYLPFARAGNRIYPDFQIWMLDPEGRYFRLVALGAFQRMPTEIEFTDEITTDLAQLQKQKDAVIDSGGLLTTMNDQAGDLARLSQPPQNLIPNLPDLRDGLVKLASDSPAGGFPFGGQQRLYPTAWNLLFATNGAGSVVPSILPLLKSPCVDLVDGGFFYRSSTLNWSQPGFDKVAVINGEMCVLMARLAQADPGGPYAYLERTTFDSLTGEFLDSQGLIRSCRIGDEGIAMNRSGRSSFPPRLLHSLISGPDALLKNRDENWAIQNLSLRPTVNPTVVPYVTDFSVLTNPTLSRVLQKLRTNPVSAQFDDEVTLDSCSATAARLLEAARLMGDADRIQKADEIVSKLDLFRRGTTVLHELVPSDRAQPVLSDYVGYADAQLQDFLTFGRVASLETGAAVLESGMTQFAYPGAACYRMASEASYHRRAPDSNSPQLCDDIGESANAKAIRLAWCYGNLLAKSTTAEDRALGTKLRTQAGACVTQFADISSVGGPSLAGYALASALVRDDTFVLCAGPDPAKMVQAMSLREPNRMIAPVAGPVYPELFKRPGYYVNRRGQLLGPFTLDAASRLLSPTLVINQ